MEDADSDAEMADYGTDFSDDVDPNFDHELDLMKGHSRIGNRIPRFLGGPPGFSDSRLAANRESGNPPFPDSAGNRESGSRGGGTPGTSWSAPDLALTLRQFKLALIVEPGAGGAEAAAAQRSNLNRESAASASGPQPAHAPSPHRDSTGRASTRTRRGYG
jgi:hypothetical protein